VPVAAPLLVAPTAAPAPAKPPPELLAADTPRATASGATFTAPGGWFIRTEGALVVLDAPEGDAHVAIVDAPAGNAEAAVAAAWALYQPSFKRPLPRGGPPRASNGWDERRWYEYERSNRAARSVLALRRGETWTVLILDASGPAFERRGAAMQLVLDSLRAKGFVRESFAGKKAHPLDAERIGRITAFVEASQKDLGVPGVAVALVDGGKVVFEGGFGVREIGKPAKVDKDTLFMIGSNTKGMTTLLLAKLVDENKLAWDMPVVNAYPGFKLGDAETTAKVQVKHLVCACTGLPRQDMEWRFKYGKLTPKSTMDLLATMTPTTKFGEVWQYSNLLAAAGGWVAAHAVHPDQELGAAYDAAMQELVFGPLEMKTATFDFARVRKAHHASPHSIDIESKHVPLSMDVDRTVIPLRPAGGIWASVHDMTKYVLLELSKGVLPNGKRQISEDALLARRAPIIAMAEDETYGMGLMVDNHWGTPYVHHGGDITGYHSDWVIFPEHGVGAVILTNSDFATPMLEPFIRRIAEVIFDGSPRAADDLAHSSRLRVVGRENLAVPADPAFASKLAPHYVSPELGTLEVRRERGSTRFDFGEFSSAVVSFKDGTKALITIDHPISGVTFVVGERDGKRTLTIRDAQHEYVFTEN
jgi:CubicO group peptidase (beta-lactamase class C family)